MSEVDATMKFPWDDHSTFKRLEVVVTNCRQRGLQHGTRPENVSAEFKQAVADEVKIEFGHFYSGNSIYAAYVVARLFNVKEILKFELDLASEIVALRKW